MELTDEQIAGMTPRERQELIWRLARPTSELVPSVEIVRRMRRLRLGVIVASTALLVPWIVFLGITLPSHYVVRNWTITWLGFDLILLVMFTTTALLGYLQRQLLILTAFASGVLLVCDAWFDITTAAPGDVWWSVSSAVMVEMPIAVLLIRGSFRLIRITAARLWALEPGAHLWQLPIPIPELWE